MTEEITRIAIASLVSKVSGLNFPVSHWGDLDRGIRKTCEELQIPDHKILIQQLLTKEPEIHLLECLINNLTIGETYFFREKPILQAFTDSILPRLDKAAERKERVFNIWCAGCCTGEEPYTLAILLKEHLNGLKEWKIQITATDINKNFLNRAVEGKYSAWSFRDTPVDLRKKYFTSEGNGYIIKPEIKKMVTFFHLNLVEPQLSLHGIHPEQTDVIFCRNVLMYFAPETIKKIYESFLTVLVPGGWLVTSSVELPPVAPIGFRYVKINQITLLQKSGNDADQEDKISPNFSKRDLSTNKIHSSRLPVKEMKKVKAVSEPDLTIRKVPVIDPTKKATRAFQKKDYGEVIRIVHNEKPDHRNSDLQILLIKSYANTGDLEKANDLCMDMIGKPNPGAHLFYLKASILSEMGNDLQAEEALRKAIYLNPDMVLAHFMMGNLLQRKKQMHMSAKHFQTALDLIEELPHNHIIPDSDGITAGYLKGIVKTYINHQP